MQPQVYTAELHTAIESELRRLSAQDFIVQDRYGYLAIGQNNPQWMPEGCLEALKALPDGKMLFIGESGLYELVERPSFDRIDTIIETTINRSTDANCWSQIGDGPLYTWLEGKARVPLNGIPGKYAIYYLAIWLGAYH
jgi:hypothetical protein